KDDEINREELQVSLYVLSFGSEAEAVDYQQRIADTDYLTVWNTLRSDLLANPPVAPVVTEDGVTETPEEPTSTATATEYVWRNQEGLELTLGITVTATILDDLSIGETSDIVMNAGADGLVTYYIVQLSGRELRPVTETVIEQQKVEFFSTWLEEVRIDGFEDLGGWRSRAPRQPAIDARYLVAQPTFTPAPVPTVAPEEDPAGNETNQENNGNNSEGE
ncbi:MAG: hypothetical protein IPL78_27340, partial [Chloroflexi bacterium]|nr:hypothetical protein [Chloroflexota bacterium]